MNLIVEVPKGKCTPMPLCDIALSRLSLYMISIWDNLGLMLARPRTVLIPASE